MEKLQVRPLSVALAEKAKSELNENPEKIAEELEALRSWLSEQPHINARQDDQFLIAFLRKCKYNQERAREKIDAFYTIRGSTPAIFKPRDLTPKLQEILKLRLTKPLPTVDDKTGARIIFSTPVAYNPRQFSVPEFVKVFYMIQDMLLLEDDHLGVSGEIFVVDMKGLSFGHVLQFSPSLIKKVASLLQEAYPIRLKGFHFLNVLPICDTMLKIFSNFLNSKLRNLIFVHDSIEALHEHINKEVLPTEYGGNAGSVETIAVDLPEKIMQWREWLVEDVQYKTDESKRPRKPKKSILSFW